MADVEQAETEESPEMPAEIVALQEIIEDLKPEGKRLQDLKRSLVAAIRAEKVTPDGVASDILDELLNQHEVLVDALKRVTHAIDGAFQYCDEISEQVGDEEEEGDDDSEESLLTGEDARLIGGALTMALAKIQHVTQGKPDGEWTAVLSELNRALQRVGELEAPPAPPAPQE